MQQLDLFRPEPLKLKKLKDPLGKGGLQLLVVGKPPSRHQFRHLLRDRLADPLDRAETLLGDQPPDRLTQRLQRPGGIRIGADLERILPLQFQKLGNMLQDLPHLGSGNSV